MNPMTITAQVRETHRNPKPGKHTRICRRIQRRREDRTWRAEMGA
jgi:hypothetical protein